MNALQQSRLVLAIGAVAAVCALISASLARDIDSADPIVGVSVHVVWALIAGLGLLLAQCWVLLFAWGSTRLLAGLERPSPRALRAALIALPVAVVAAVTGVFWIGLRGVGGGQGSSLHATLGWLTVAWCGVALLAEWRLLEALDRRMSEAEARPAGR